MASGLFAGLGLDKDNFSNRFILIGEQNMCDSSFLIASFIWQGLYKVDKDIPANICVLSLHNARDHYENLAIKLGYNIDNYVKKGNLKFLDGFKIVSSYFSDENFVKLNYSRNVFDCFLKDLFFLLKENIDLFLKERLNGGCVYVIIDDLSDLLSVGFTLKAVLSFVKYLRAFLSTVENFTLIIGTHFNESDHEQCILYKNMYRVADYCTTVSGLKTGFSVDVSGSIKVVRKFLDVRNGLKESKTDFYHFKLSDRQIKIFSPGSIL